MADVAAFSEIAEKFDAIVRRVVWWCTFTTIDRQGRPRARILHPIWEGSTGWIATGRQSLKAKHITAQPYVSVSYWDQVHEQVHAECRAEWDDSQAAKQHLWDLYKRTPPPLGYDLNAFWKSTDDPTFGALKLTPWRVEIWSVGAMSKGEPPLVWRQNA